jgi:hypothetical protein
MSLPEERRPCSSRGRGCRRWVGIGLFIAFWAAFPVNRVLISRGHAAVHAYH